LADLFDLPRSEIDGALLALEAEGFILRGRFRGEAAGTSSSRSTRARADSSTKTEELEWCDRRLLARIHRLTINRLRAEIQPVPIAEFHRFLLGWQRADAEHRIQGPDGVAAVLDLLDGYQLPAAAWEPEVLALRVKDYTPAWLDQLCFTGRIGWGRLTPPQWRNGRPSAPVRSSPISLFSREHLQIWLEVSAAPAIPDFTPDTVQVLNALSDFGAQFFHELVKRSGLLPSRVEQALGELVAQGWATSDSFEGLRALLLPQDRRTSHVDPDRKRHHKVVTGVEMAGRWSLLRDPKKVLSGEKPGPSTAPSVSRNSMSSDRSVELFARTLLRRYGIVFRRLLDRESFAVSWYELGRVYRRLEARGEIRGGHFVSGVSGEQFALPEAIGSLRALRKTAPTGELIAISGADPLNLGGILSPGTRIPAVTANRILLRDGVPIAALESGQFVPLDSTTQELVAGIQRALRVGTLPAGLRPYYAHHR
jgi:ATP-dependent Lhr-like helicase